MKKYCLSLMLLLIFIATSNAQYSKENNFLNKGLQSKDAQMSANIVQIKNGETKADLIRNSFEQTLSLNYQKSSNIIIQDKNGRRVEVYTVPLDNMTNTFAVVANDSEQSRAGIVELNVSQTEFSLGIPSGFSLGGFGCIPYCINIWDGGGIQGDGFPDYTGTMVGGFIISGCCF